MKIKLLVAMFLGIGIGQPAFAGGSHSTYGYGSSYSLLPYSVPTPRSSSPRIETMPNSPNYSSVYVRPYVHNDGTAVLPHYRSAPNSSLNDNWSTLGNVNPFTGQKGYKRQVDIYR